MSFPQQRQRRRQQQCRQRGFYVTRACTNCRQKHVKCSGRASCERCTLRNLECNFIDSGKRRGPKTNNRKHSENVYFLNGHENHENDLDGTFILSSMIPKPVQNHASNLSPYGHPQQLTNFDEVFLYSDSYKEKTTHSFQEVSSFSYQAHTDTGYTMQNNNLTDIQ